MILRVCNIMDANLALPNKKSPFQTLANSIGSTNNSRTIYQKIVTDVCQQQL